MGKIANINRKIMVNTIMEPSPIFKEMIENNVIYKYCRES
jgi:hypothetical protein